MVGTNAEPPGTPKNLCGTPRNPCGTPAEPPSKSFSAEMWGIRMGAKGDPLGIRAASAWKMEIRIILEAKSVGFGGDPAIELNPYVGDPDGSQGGSAGDPGGIRMENGGSA